ncbi:MAG: hypothetical protein ACK55Z_34170, partial [bacterium]
MHARAHVRMNTCMHACLLSTVDFFNIEGNAFAALFIGQFGKILLMRLLSALDVGHECFVVLARVSQGLTPRCVLRRSIRTYNTRANTHGARTHGSPICAHQHDANGA